MKLYKVVTLRRDYYVIASEREHAILRYLDFDGSKILEIYCVKEIRNENLRGQV